MWLDFEDIQDIGLGSNSIVSLYFVMYCMIGIRNYRICFRGLRNVRLNSSVYLYSNLPWGILILALWYLWFGAFGVDIILSSYHFASHSFLHVRWQSWSLYKREESSVINGVINALNIDRWDSLVEKFLTLTLAFTRFEVFSGWDTALSLIH